MNNTNHNDTADLLAGLHELKERAKLSSRRNGRHFRHRIFMTEMEHMALSVMRATVALHIGRNVSLPLITRLALDELAGRCTRSLSDPVEAAKLRADILAVREERMTRRTDG